MREIKGNLWSYFERFDTIICITTNGTIKNNGEAVMGRGCAFEAATKYSFLPALLGRKLKNGNVPYVFRIPRGQLGSNTEILTFPVKHEWHQKANIDLIRLSAKHLEKIADSFWQFSFILPRPGCGNGGLRWEDVKSVIQFLPDNVSIISRPEEQ
jgi:hypothetical protein